MQSRMHFFLWHIREHLLRVPRVVRNELVKVGQCLLPQPLRALVPIQYDTAVHW